jgi:hypothetical protein
MSTTAPKKVSRSPAPLGQRVTEVAGFALVRIEAKKRSRTVLPEDSATELVKRAGQALKRPGIDRQVVFRGERAGIFSYSAYAGDPTKVVREAADGSKRIGRLVNGKFVPAKTPA